MFNFKTIKITFLFLILAELLSFLAWKFSVVNLICFLVILLITLILSLKKLEYGLYILLAELFVGSFGYLFSLDLSGTKISLRIGLFLIVMTVWLYRELTRITTRINVNKNLFKIKEFKILGLFAIVILWAFIWGLIRNNFGNVFFDFNNWLYWLLILPILSIQDKDKFIKNILSILIASVILIFTKTIVLFYIFSHNYAEIMGTVYRWVRDTRIGEITLMNGNFYRIFIQSQIYSLILFFIILMTYDLRLTTYDKIKKVVSCLLLVVCLITIILSFSRSYWIGLIIALLLYCFITLLHKNKILKILKLIFRLILIMIFGLAVISLVFILPPKTEGQDLFVLFKSRATQSEAASSSRMNQLKPLMQEIIKHPVIGSGFGTQVTYVSDDPRIAGEITTYAFEWGYFDMILKFGLIGLIVYLMLIYKISKKLFQTKKYGWLLALIGLLIVNIFSPYLNHPLGIGFLLICLVIFLNKNSF